MAYYNTNKKNYSELINQLKSISSNLNELDNLLSSLKIKMVDTVTVDKNILENNAYSTSVNYTNSIRNDINKAINNVSNR